MKPLLLAAVLILLLGSHPALAALRRVPSQYPTVQAAITASMGGDVIEISEGVYYERLDINLKSRLTIRPRGSDRVTIDAQAAGVAIHVDNSDRVMLKNLRVRNTTGTSGILLEYADRSTVTGCRVTGAAGNGINVSVESQGTTIEKCRISDVSEAGIHVGCRNVVVIGNSITAVGGTGVHVRGNDVLVARCKIRGVGRHGIDAAGQRVTIQENTLSYVPQNAIQVGWTGDPIEGCLVAGNRILRGVNQGIFVGFNVDGCSVLENVVKSSTDNGIELIYVASDNLVASNAIGGSGTTGINCDSGGTAVLGNRLKKCHVAVQIGHHAGGVMMTENRAKRSRTDGLVVQGEGNTFVSNRVTGSAGYDLNDLSVLDENLYVSNTFGSVAP